MALQFSSRPVKQENNNNNKIEKQAVFEAPKIMKMFVYVYNTALLVLGISKEDFKGFLKPL